MTNDSTPASKATLASSLPDPGPIGLAAFAATTLVLSVFNAGMLTDGIGVVLPLALFYGGVVQLVVGVFELFRKNLFGGAAFMTYGAFWIAFNGVAQLDAPAKAVATFLLAFTIFTVAMAVISAKTNVGLLLVFSLLAITFILLTAGDFSGKAGVTHAGGYFGLATALVAWYVSFAGIANATWGRKVLPNKAL